LYASMARRRLRASWTASTMPGGRDSCAQIRSDDCAVCACELMAASADASTGDEEVLCAFGFMVLCCLLSETAFTFTCLRYTTSGSLFFNTATG